MSYQPVWGAAIAWYLFLAGVGAGAFMTAVFILRKTPTATRTVRAAFCMTSILVAIGLVLLMVDAEGGLHNPLRFALLLTNFGSVMTWGVVFLSLFEIVALACAILSLLKRPQPKVLLAIGCVTAAAVALYTGCLLGACRTFPLWNNPLLPVLFLVSAVSTGAAAVLLASALAFPSEFDRLGLTKKFHLVFPAFEVLLVASLLFIVAQTSDAGLHSVQALLVGRYALLFWIGFAIVGLIGPLLLEAKLLFRSSESFEQSPAAHRLSAASSLAVLVGGFLLRYLIVAAALPVTIAVPVL